MSRIVADIQGGLSALSRNISYALKKKQEAAARDAAQAEGGAFSKLRPEKSISNMVIKTMQGFDKSKKKHILSGSDTVKISDEARRKALQHGKEPHKPSGMVEVNKKKPTLVLGDKDNQPSVGAKMDILA